MVSRPSLFVLFLCVLTGALSGCTMTPLPSRNPNSLRAIEVAPWADPDKVLVTVNERPITRGEFYRRVLERLGTAELLSGVVKDELIRQEAERRNLVVSDDEAEEEASRVLESMAEKVGGREQLTRLYEEQGITMAALRSELVRKMKAELLTIKVIRSMRRLDEEVLREYYKRTYGNRRYVTRHIAFSFRPPNDRPDVNVENLKKTAYLKALNVVDRLRQGADFETTARTESEDEVTRDTGGQLGEITEYSPMPSALKEAIFALSEGEISEPVENPRGGYHVFQVTEIHPPASYAECEEKMRRELKERVPTPREIQKVLNDLRSAAKIELVLDAEEGSDSEEERKEKG